MQNTPKLTRVSTLTAVVFRATAMARATKTHLFPSHNEEDEWYRVSTPHQNSHSSLRSSESPQEISHRYIHRIERQTQKDVMFHVNGDVIAKTRDASRSERRLRSTNRRPSDGFARPISRDSELPWNLCQDQVNSRVLVFGVKTQLNDINLRGRRRMGIFIDRTKNDGLL